MNIEFRSAMAFKKGIVADLLGKSYAELTSSGAPWDAEGLRFLEYDNAVFGNPDTVGKCIFISCLDGVPVGFASWDPRGRPDFVTVGHNCVLPEFRKRGIGRAQMLELFRRISSLDFRLLKVSTCEYPFFIPASKMYCACGFIETARLKNAEEPHMIEYEISRDAMMSRIKL